MSQVRKTPGAALRERLFDRLSPLLSSTDAISDSTTRLLLQAYCLDLVAEVEDVIGSLALDEASEHAEEERILH